MPSGDVGEPWPIADAERRARSRFVEAAEAYRENLERRWDDALPGNHSPADALLLAHLMTTHDGYNPVQFVSQWDGRPTSGWQTCLAYLAVPEPRLVLPFAIEARHGAHARQLAVLIDRHRPGERTPDKQQKEQRIAALGFRLLVFTEVEIRADPSACRERVEDLMFEMIEDAMIDSGLISGQRDRSPADGA